MLRPIVFSKPVRAVSPLSWLSHTPFAFWLVDAARPSTLVELGTHTGNSYSAFAQAVAALGLATACHAVDTWEGDKHAGFYADDVFAEWKTFHDSQFGRFSTLIRATFDEACERFTDGSIDILHIDGLHTYEAVRHDFDTWLPRLSSRGIVLLHDTNVRGNDFGVWQLWEEKRSAYPSIDFLHGHGLGVLGVGTEIPGEVMSLFAAEPGERALFRQLFAALGESHVYEAELAGSRADTHALSSALDEASEANGQLRGDLARVESIASRLRAKLAAVDPDDEGASAERVAAIEASGLFDEAFYLERYPDVRESGLDPLVHFDDFGWREGRQPNRIFDPLWYVRAYPDVGIEDTNPLVHYVQHGWREGRDPSAAFSVSEYLDAHPELAATGEEPLSHYLRSV